MFVRPWPEHIMVPPREPMLSVVILSTIPFGFFRDRDEVRWERLCRRWAAKHSAQ